MLYLPLGVQNYKSFSIKETNNAEISTTFPILPTFATRLELDSDRQQRGKIDSLCPQKWIAVGVENRQRLRELVDSR